MLGIRCVSTYCICVQCFPAGMCNARRWRPVAILHQHAVSTVSRQLVSWCCNWCTIQVLKDTHQPSEALCWLTVPKVGQQVSEHLHCYAMRHAPRECIKGLLPICFCPGLSPRVQFQMGGQHCVCLLQDCHLPFDGHKGGDVACLHCT